jgi:hypothetical protein
MNALCLITLRPNKIWCDFLNTFSKYKIFVIIDDNNFDASSFKSNYSNITFIQINDQKCKDNFFINTSYIVFKKEIIGWEKALYYFSIENINHNYIWFMEDDVFFYNENTIENIDMKYKCDDLLSRKYDINKHGNTTEWLWNRINMYNISPPYYNGMMCCVRFSKKMLEHIHNYGKNNKTLLFLEALFPTIAIKNNLIYNTPDEFDEIHWRKDFVVTDLIKSNLYHPIKNLEQHITFRNLI